MVNVVINKKNKKNGEDHPKNIWKAITLKGMVHMLTMLTYIEQIDIGEYKNPL